MSICLEEKTIETVLTTEDNILRMPAGHAIENTCCLQFKLETGKTKLVGSQNAYFSSGEEIQMPSELSDDSSNDSVIVEPEDEDDMWEPIQPKPASLRRRRVLSWSSERDLHRFLQKQFDDQDVDDEENDNDDEEDFYGGPLNLLLTTPSAAIPRSKRKLTPAALALAHGNVLDQECDTIPINPLGNTKSASTRTGFGSSFETRRTQPESRFTKTPSTSSLCSKSLPPQKKEPTRWLVPMNHPMKVLWDVFTVCLSVYNVYCTHAAIRDRRFESRPAWIELWFILDIALNFISQRTTHDGTLLVHWQSVWARYLTSWFVIDVLALFPGELIYLQPVIDMNRKQKWWSKIFRRTKIGVKVTTRILQSGHVSWLYRCFVKAQARPVRTIVKIVKWCIKYIPKYILFVRGMKGWILVRALRDWGHVRVAWRHACCKDEVITVDMTEDLDDENSNRNTRPAWEGLNEEEYDYHEDDQDGDPF